MGESWRTLANEAKETYNSQAKELTKAYNTAYRSWYEGLSPETIRAIEKSTGRSLSRPGGRRRYNKEAADKPGNPGRPIGAFFEFLREYRTQHPTAGGTMADNQALVKRAAEEYRDMSDAEKQVRPVCTSSIGQWSRTGGGGGAIG